MGEEVEVCRSRDGHSYNLGGASDNDDGNNADGLCDSKPLYRHRLEDLVGDPERRDIIFREIFPHLSRLFGGYPCRKLEYASDEQRNPSTTLLLRIR